MKKQVYIIDLGTGTDRSLLPLASGLIASYAMAQPDLADKIKIDILMMEDTLGEVLDTIENPEVIGISCYVWNFLGSAELSRMIKEKFPSTQIVWGGPCIPAKYPRIQEFMDEHVACDILVHGEGEITFSEILRARLNETSLESCNGITFRSESKLVTTPARERIKDFTQVPSPYLNGIFDTVLERYRSQIVGALWETSRGCPFRCAFCDWGSALVNKVNRFEVERVMQEIEWVSKNKIHYVYATDANFGISFKRDLEIAQRFIDIKNKNGFPNTLVLNWTKNSSENIIEIADVLFQGGVITNTTLTYQSFHQPTLDAIQRQNIKLDVYRELKRAFHARGLPTYTELILGLPEETLQTFISGINKAVSPSLSDQLSLYLCVLLENTHLHENRDKFGLETRACPVGLNRRRFKYQRFGVDEIIVGTNTMPVEDWRKAYQVAFCFASLYNLRVAFFPMVYLWKRYECQPTDFIEFLINDVDNDPAKFPCLAKGMEHLRKNSDAILNNIGSVLPVEGSDGVHFTPHEALTLLLLNNTTEVYQELQYLVEAFCESRQIDISPLEIEELLRYQAARVPVFAPTTFEYKFETNIPMIIEAITKHEDGPALDFTPTKVTIKPAPHSYTTEKEFNLRRVACGYTLNLFDVTCTSDESVSETNIPAARNVNLSGKF